MVAESDREFSQRIVRGIQAMWATVLKLDIADIDANFFDAGGYSLLLLDLKRQMEKEFGVTVQILELFKNPTIRSQANLLVSATRGGDTVPQPGPSVFTVNRALLALRRSSRSKTNNE